MRKAFIAILSIGFLFLTAPSVTPAATEGVDARGFLHGTVETRSGKQYTGLLRWGNEEAFWDDLFNSSKRDLPYMDLRPEEEERSEIRIFGLTIGYSWDGSATSRQFVSRFGDIVEIRPGRGSRAEVLMKSGTTYRIDGASNDLGGTIVVLDVSLGEVEVPWKRVERIVFSPTPAAVRAPATRLYGKLVTEDDTFEGWIQWDSQECLSTDKLDGESEDGDLSIEMGKIRAIERASRRGAYVELKDGRKLLLKGTNDVNDSIRGIFVEDERYGRVKVSWDVFDRVDFIDTAKSGRGYDEYAPGRALTGTVTDRSDRTHTGPLVFDLDETESWELLHADRYGVEYIIPFDLIRSIEPDRRDGSKVTLKSGSVLEFEEGHDVSERNAGLAILAAGDEESRFYLPWENARRIEFQ